MPQVSAGWRQYRRQATTKMGRLTRNAHFCQSLRGLCDHVDTLLQLALQIRHVHLVRDAISVIRPSILGERGA
jgi:hypothetical protein